MKRSIEKMKTAVRCLGVVIGLLNASAVMAAPPAAPKDASIGACESVDWLCVSECADHECAEGCMGKGCMAATKKYAACTRLICPETDAGCSEAASECGGLCREAFGRTPEIGAKGRWSCHPDGNGSAKDSLPQSALGFWILDGASIPQEENSAEDDQPPSPRADFRRRLNLLAGDCFAQESLLEEPTVGPGNQIAVRSMGHLSYRAGKLTLTPEEREAETSLCGQPATRPLPNRAMTAKTYKFEREGDELTLTDTGAGGQMLHYSRAGSADAGSVGAIGSADAAGGRTLDTPVEVSSPHR